MSAPPTPALTMPATLQRAVRVLWCWVGYLLVWGAWQSYAQIPKLRDYIPDELTLDNRSLFALSAGFYLVSALTWVGVVAQIKTGHRWARLTLLISALFDLGAFVWPPLDGWPDNVLALINLGLECYPLWLLYRWPARTWFQPKPAAPRVTVAADETF